MKVDREYEIENATPSQFVIRGILRLESPRSYDEPFQTIRSAIEKGAEDLKIDIVELTFMNSSGINALAHMFVFAREKNVPIHLVGSEHVPWQRRSIPSLGTLWSGLDIDLKV